MTGPDPGPPELPGMAAVRMGVALAATLDTEQALNAGLDEMEPLIAQFGGPHLTEQAHAAMAELRRVLNTIGDVVQERLKQSAVGEPGAEPVQPVQPGAGPVQPDVPPGVGGGGG